MVGVWIAPVIAQVMMTLSVTAMESNSQRSSSADVARRPPLVGGQRHQTPVSPFLTFDKLIGGQPCAALALNLRQHRPGPIDASLHLLKQVRIDTLIAVDIVAHTGGGVEIDRLEWPHEAPAQRQPFTKTDIHIFDARTAGGYETKRLLQQSALHSVHHEPVKLTLHHDRSLSGRDQKVACPRDGLGRRP